MLPVFKMFPLLYMTFSKFHMLKFMLTIFKIKMLSLNLTISNFHMLKFILTVSKFKLPYFMLVTDSWFISKCRASNLFINSVYFIFMRIINWTTSKLYVFKLSSWINFDLLQGLKTFWISLEVYMHLMTWPSYKSGA